MQLGALLATRLGVLSTGIVRISSTVTNSVVPNTSATDYAVSKSIGYALQQIKH